MPVDRAHYPSDWAEIRAEILARAAYACEDCGVPNGTWIFSERREGKAAGWRGVLHARWIQDVKGTPAESFAKGRRYLDLRTGDPVVQVVLTVAHVYDEDPMNVARWNLRALCQFCHNRLDAPRRAARRRRRRRGARAVKDLFG